MSYSERNIRLTPPASMRPETECFTASGFCCPYCNGEGGFSEIDNNKVVYTECTCCHGAGSLKAVVSVVWMPDNKNDL